MLLGPSATGDRSKTEQAEIAIPVFLAPCCWQTAPMTGHLLNTPALTVPHGFLSRHGGVSTGVYSSLNCGPGSADDPDMVLENRRVAAGLIAGRRITPVISCYQVHGSAVEIVTADWRDDRPKADAMVTRTPGMLLGILTADCVPVLFADSAAGVVGAAHAGWKGALAGVIEATVAAMVGLGASREGIRAAVGPAIGQASYEVGSDLRSQFAAADTDYLRFFQAGRDDAHWQFDLPGFVADRLEAAAIDQAWNCGIDTYRSPDHFSFRRTTHRHEADYGRQLSAIMLAG